MWLRTQAMHSFFHRDNVALPGFSAMFKVRPADCCSPAQLSKSGLEPVDMAIAVRDCGVAACGACTVRARLHRLMLR